MTDELVLMAVAVCRPKIKVIIGSASPKGNGAIPA